MKLAAITLLSFVYYSPTFAAPSSGVSDEELLPTTAQLSRGTPLIEGIHFEEGAIYSIEKTAATKNNISLVAKVEGQLWRKSSTLLYNQHFAVGLTPNGKFKLHVTLSQKKPTQFTLTLVDNLGQVSKEQLTLNPIQPTPTPTPIPVATPSPSPVPTSTPIPTPTTKPTLSTAWNASLGVTSLNYTETNITPYTAISITSKIGFNRPIRDTSWSINSNLFATLVPITNAIKSISVRFIGVNVKMAYWIQLSQNWEFTPMFGAYYTTMMVTQNAFGFNSMYGPQLYGTLSRGFGTRVKLSTYGKYSPLSSSSGINFSNREISYGISILREIKNHTFSLAVDWSQILLNFNNIITIRTHTQSLNVGMSF